MKYSMTAIAFIFSAVIALAQPAPEKIIVTIKDGKFLINKTAVSAGWRQDEVSMDLGINDRRRSGANVTHTYDNYGIVLFEKSLNNVASGILAEIQFFIAAGDSNAVTPKSFFVGKMKIEKLKISSNLSWNEVKEQLKAYKQTESYIEHSYRLAYNGIYIYFQFNQTETQLLKISVGKDKKD